MKLALRTIAAMLVFLPFAAESQITNSKVIENLKAQGIETTRQVHFDLCYPASYQEYVSVGKYAIVMLEASTVISDELPIRAAYLIQKTVRLPLQRVAVFDKSIDAAGAAKQVCFYLVPIASIKAGASLMVDFTGDRKAFGVTAFDPKAGPGDGVPAPIRLDEYDAPSDPDPTALAQLLFRE